MADATSYLGYYIAILATEYQLLALNGQDTKITKHELFCALNAINRLDHVAETYFGGQGTLNGYFVRDDIPGDFVKKNYQHFNYYNKSNNVQINPYNLSPYTGYPYGNNDARGFDSKFQGGAFAVSSSLEGWKTFTNSVFYNSGNGPPHNIIGPIPEMSQDQAISILYGLAFVKKFIPPGETDEGATFLFGSSETSIANEANNITDRIINHIKASKDESGNSCLANVSTGWHIKNAVNCHPVGYNHDDSHHGWGDDAEVFSYAIAEAGHVIKQSDFGDGGNFSLTPNYPKRGAQLFNNTDYHNFFSSEFGDDLWHVLAKDFIPGNGDNRLHVVNLSAVCDCVYGSIADKYEQWVEDVFENVPVLNWLGFIIKWVTNLLYQIIHTFLALPGYYFNNTSTSININSYYSASDFDHAPLSRKVLHGGAYIQNQDYSFQYLLDTAPCDDIYYLSNETPKFGHAQWSSSDRIEHPKQRQDGIGSASDAPSNGEYSGLDYLLYHNLWYIHEAQEGGLSSPVYDISNVYINKNGGLVANTSSFNRSYNAFETITTENTKFDYSDQTTWALTHSTMRAGKEIDFKPGTEILSGSNLRAYIQKFDCAVDNSSFRLLNNDSSSNTPSVDLQPNYVSYPKQEISKSITDPHFNNLIVELPLENQSVPEQTGESEYSKELFVKPTITTDNVKVYFKMDEKELAFINLIDLEGKNLYSNNYVGKEQSGLNIDLINLPAGTYLLKFTTTKGTSKTQKIIKQ